MTFYKLKCLMRHLWLDKDDAQKAVPPALLAQLARRVAASESRHSGEVRICVEAALPLSYVWRLSASQSMAALVRQRAVMMFAKLRVWDTDHNNGVLIYVLLGEHAIEIVADRGLARRIPDPHWQSLVARMGEQFRRGLFEEGLTEALAEVSSLLMAHFPDDATPQAAQANALPDEPYLN